LLFLSILIYTLIMLTIDSLDQSLLDALRVDSRTPVTELARRLGVARGTVQSRVARLENTGVIASYTIRSTGGAASVQAYVAVTLSPKIADEARTAAALKKMPEVRALYSVAGPYDWLALLSAATTDALDQAIDRLRALPGIAGTVSQIVLSTKFER
jgi:DNA-binding Lrp family transcriptional regulator